MGNGVIDGLADQYWAKVKPHAYDLAAVVKCYADDMLRELRTIATAVNNDEAPNIYHKYAGVVQPGGTGTVLIDSVPVGREFEIVYASLVAIATTQTWISINGFQAIRTIDTSFNSNVAGSGLILRGGDVLTVTTNVGGGTSYYVVVRERQPQEFRMSLGVQGAENPVKWQNGMHPDILSHIQDRNVKQGQNVIGANRED